MAIPLPNQPITITASAAKLGGARGRVTGVLIRGGTAAASDVRIRSGQLVGGAVIVPQIVAATNTTEGFVGFPVPFVDGIYVEATVPAGAEITVYWD